jgi:hypothetical protein
MADSRKDHERTTLTVAEAQALAERLNARGTSFVLSDVPEMQADLRLAFRIISGFTNLHRQIARAIESTDDLVIRSYLLDLLGERR